MRWPRRAEGSQRDPAQPSSFEGFSAAIAGALTVALLSSVAFRGWIPHDEGTLGQAAVRVLHGQWPHADFFDVYPGLLGVIHAGIFSLLGESIAALRFAWLGVAAMAAMSLCCIARLRLGRWLSIVGSVSLVTLAFVIYPASMPTWWNLSLALTAVALVFLGWSKGRTSYVFGAGLMIGASILIKTTGGLLVAIAIYVWLLNANGHRDRWYTRLSIGLALAVVIALFAPALTFGRFLLLGLPVVLVLARLPALSLSVAGRERPGGFRTSQLPWWFGGGVVVLPALAVLVYALVGRLDALLVGWVLSPALRFESASGDVPVLPQVLLVLVLIGVASIIIRRTGSDITFWSVALVGELTIWALLDWTAFGPMFFFAVAWAALLVASLFIWWHRHQEVDPLLLLVVMTALMFTLIQIPLWNGYYAAYTVPLLGLSVLFLLRRGRVLMVSIIAVMAAVFLFQSMAGRLVGQHALADPVQYVELVGPRSGITIPAFHSYYNDLIAQLPEVAGSHPVYAGPDAPEVAFLARVEPVTSAFFEILDPSWNPEIVAEFARDGSAVIVNTRPGFSDPLSDHVLSEIRDLTENRATIGKFVLMWSNPDD